MNIIEINLETDETIAFIGDLHLDNRTVESRVDDIMQTAQRKLMDVLEKCVARKVRVLFLSGDVFNRLAVTHQTVNEFGSMFLKFREAGIRVCTIIGNHDIVRNNLENFQKSPLSTLITFGIIEHIHLSNRVVINRKILITPVDYTEYPPKAEPAAGFNILLAHMFYNQSSMMADERHNLSKADVEQLGYDLIYLGHDHEEYKPEKAGKTLVLRSGSMLRGTLHNYNFQRKPCFLVLGDLNDIRESTIERVDIHHAPFEEVASSYVMNKKSMGSISGLKDVLSNLAVRLSEGASDDGDRIMSILDTDETLPPDCRTLILKYLAEA